MIYSAHNPLFFYLLSASIALFGLNEYSVRIISIIFGTLTIPLIYIFTKRLFNKHAALLSALCITFLSIGIAWSRQARAYAMLQFFFILSLYFFYEFIKTRKRQSGLLLLATTICAMLTHPLGYMLIPMGAVGLLIFRKEFRLLKKIYLRKKVVWFILTLFTFFVVNFKGKNIYHTLVSHINYSWIYINYIIGMYSFFVYSALLGIFLSKKKKEVLFLLCSFLIPLYFLMFHQKLLHFRYMYMTLPIIFILSSVSLVLVIKSIYDKSYFKTTICIGLTILFIAAALSTGIFTLSPKAIYNLEDQTPQPDFKTAYTVIYNNMDEDSVIISSYAPIASLYLRKPDYSFEFSLSGIPNSTIATCYNCSTDKYSDIQLIQDLDNFNAITSGSHGFAVIDRLSSRNIDKGIIKAMNNLTVLYSNQEDIYTGIIVYEW